MNSIALLSVVATLVLAPLSIAESAEPSKAMLNKSDFAFAVSCGEKDSPRLCLVGKFKAKTQVKLLQSAPREICSAETTSRCEQSDPSEAYLTELDGTCEPPQEFAVGVLKKPIKDYEKLFLEKITDPDRLSKTDRLVRSSKALLTLLSKAQELVPGETKDLEGITPKLYKAPLPGLDILIASFENLYQSTGICGPRLLLINDRVYPLTGWCSYQTLNVFRLNGQHYIQSGSCCCNCGITIMELFRVTPAGPVQVLSDSSLSD